MWNRAKIGDEWNPHAEYMARRGRWQLVYDADSARFARISWWRLVAAIMAVVTISLIWRQVLALWWLGAPVAAFIALVIWHDRVSRRQQLASRAIQYYDNGIARLEDRWAGTGNAGERFHDSSHVYAEDLDLFGRGSLFELISCARTAAGEQTLAAWLKSEDASPAAGRPLRSRATASELVDELCARQAAVAELRPKLDLREDLALLGEDVRSAVHPELLTGWAAEPPVVFPAWAHPVTIVLTALAMVTVAGLAAGVIPGWPFMTVIVLELIVAGMLKRKVEVVVAAVERPAHELNTLSLAIGRLEREQFASERLIELHKQFMAGEGPHEEHACASVLIARLDNLVDHRDWSENIMFRIPAFLLMWDQRYAMRIEHWRRKHGPSVARWMAVIGEMEALSSLAGFAYEHPAYPFPQFVASQPAASRPSCTAVFEAQALCHPLMSPAKCVPNDARLSGANCPGAAAPQLLIVSGSNMSGKSTLLRACGLNTVLAQCGAPVAAAWLRLSPLAVGASIRVVDSLLDNRSRFYAEITRLRQILDLTDGPRPVLFLIDEMMGGTNSHDRRVGAEALLRRLLEHGAIGMITTHDLTLADIADALTRAMPGHRLDGRPPAENVHFEDQLADGQIRFDYVLRPGIVRRSNALELMRSLGLIE